MCRSHTGHTGTRKRAVIGFKRHSLLVPTYNIYAYLFHFSEDKESVKEGPKGYKTGQAQLLTAMTNCRRMLSAAFPLFLLASSATAGSWFQKQDCSPPCVPGDESLMRPKEHGTSHTPVQSNLRWSCDEKVADNICNFNRHYAEYSGYWEKTSFLSEAAKASKKNEQITYYDSNTGKPLFHGPVDRSWDDFLAESRSHGWPSFRDDEVNWENVRVLPSGETVSMDGTHLGHNLPDRKGRRYCINLVSIAGNPRKTSPDRKEF